MTKDGDQQTTSHPFGNIPIFNIFNLPQPNLLYHKSTGDSQQQATNEDFDIEINNPGLLIPRANKFNQPVLLKNTSMQIPKRKSVERQENIIDVKLLSDSRKRLIEVIDNSFGIPEA
jgi:hypothetical protein